MKTFGVLMTLLALALVCSDSGAQCRTPIRHVVYDTYVAPVAVTPIYAAQLLIAPIVIPTYTVGIQQPVFQQQVNQVQGQAGGPDLMTELLALKKEMAELRGLPPGPPGPPQAMNQAGADPHAGVMQKHCASCHERGAAGGKAKGIAFFDGASLAPMSAELKLEVINQVLSGKMPPGGKLTDQEVAEILQGMTSRRAANPTSIPLKK